MHGEHTLETGSLQCFVDGEEQCSFAHRLPSTDINKITIEGDASLHAVHLK